ncbi:hypothetical protein EVAR_5509_1 [Eumeta japonica]|uniref:Uncharacterized protein n=1 Tax=Eumeta variegata TaxID=151549 RepID=A0A4C1TBX8_EUMVA|nr:hypothetical protein EVAR_5509_1 [Eumeta japonica]
MKIECNFTCKLNDDNGISVPPSDRWPQPLPRVPLGKRRTWVCLYSRQITNDWMVVMDEESKNAVPDSPHHGSRQLARWRPITMQSRDALSHAPAPTAALSRRVESAEALRNERDVQPKI